MRWSMATSAAKCWAIPCNACFLLVALSCGRTARASKMSEIFMEDRFPKHALGFWLQHGALDQASQCCHQDVCKPHSAVLLCCYGIKQTALSKYQVASPLHQQRAVELWHCFLQSPAH